MGVHEGMTRTEEITWVLKMGVAAGGGFTSKRIDEVDREEVPAAVRARAPSPSGVWASGNDLHIDRIDFAMLPAAGANAAVYFIAQTKYSLVDEADMINECRSIVALDGDGRNLGSREESALVTKLQLESWGAIAENAARERMLRGSGRKAPASHL